MGAHGKEDLQYMRSLSAAAVHRTPRYLILLILIIAALVALYWNSRSHRRLSDLCRSAFGAGDKPARLLLLVIRGGAKPPFEPVAMRAMEVENDH